MRHRSGGLKMEFHGIGAVGQDVAFRRGEHETAHVQTQHGIGGREVILAPMPSLTPDHLIEEGRTLLVVEDHSTGTNALQHKVGGTFLGAHIDVQGRRSVFVLFEPCIDGQAIVRGAALGFFMFHGHRGGRAQREVIRAGHNGVTAAGHRASLGVNEAPTEALELEVFANVEGTAVVEVDAGCVPTAVVDHVSRRVGRPPVRTACGRRLNNQVVLAEVADAHGRLDDFSGPEGVVLPIESKREAERVGVGSCPIGVCCTVRSPDGVDSVNAPASSRSPASSVMAATKRTSHGAKASTSSWHEAKGVHAAFTRCKVHASVGQSKGVAPAFRQRKRRTSPSSATSVRSTLMPSKRGLLAMQLLAERQPWCLPWRLKRDETHAGHRYRWRGPDQRRPP